ncbi:MAG: alpha/beta hydrolase [Chloroflexi bacterium]|nr:alpha/beta hydrolase [Chloroflexota bacterium]
MDNAKFVDVQGIRTRYFEAGQGEPMVLVHGGHFGSSYNAEDWEHSFPLFAQQFHVYALDKIGQGFTDNPVRDEEYVIGATVQHLHGFLAAAGIERAHLVGHSRGGYTVTRLALEHPDVVRTLVIVDSASLMAPPNPIHAQWEAEAAGIADPRERSIHILVRNSYSAEHISRHYVDVIMEVNSLPKTVTGAARMAALFPRFAEDLVARQRETHQWIREGRLRAPTIVMWGYNDPSARFDPVGLAALGLILPSVPRSQMHILNHAGHHCFSEQPKAFVAAVSSFIRTNQVA